MSAGSGVIINTAEIVALTHLKTAPNPDGSDFTEDEIIEPAPGMVRIRLNVFSVAVVLTAPLFRLYRYSARHDKWFKGNSFIVDPAIVNTTTGDYLAIGAIEIGGGRQAIVLEDAEVGSELFAEWVQETNGSVF